MNRDAKAYARLTVIAVAAMAFSVIWPTPTRASEGRVLHFPKGRSLGAVYVLDGSLLATASYDDWQRLGEASGDVAVPAGKAVRLDLSEEAGEDLSPLATLRPDDLWGLSCRSVELADDELKHVSHLTGLHEIDLSETGILGVAALLAFIAVLVVTVWHRLRESDETNRLDLLLFSCGIVTYAAHALVSFPAHLPTSALVLVVVGGLMLSRPYGESAQFQVKLTGGSLKATLADLHQSFPRDLTWIALAANARLLKENVAQHEAVLAAIERHDAAEARRLMIEHIRTAGELVTRRFEERSA